MRQTYKSCCRSNGNQSHHGSYTSTHGTWFPYPVPYRRLSRVKAAAADAPVVVASALPANALAANADPPLNPNQPNHNNAVPNYNVRNIRAGSRPPSVLLLKNNAEAKAAHPALMCTTVPPAKSSTPF